MPAVQTRLVHDLAPRLLLFLRGALSDELRLRLIGMSGLVWLPSAGAGGMRAWVHPLAIGLTAGAGKQKAPPWWATPGGN